MECFYKIYFGTFLFCTEIKSDWLIFLYTGGFRKNFNFFLREIILSGDFPPKLSVEINFYDPLFTLFGVSIL